MAVQNSENVTVGSTCLHGHGDWYGGITVLSKENADLECDLENSLKVVTLRHTDSAQVSEKHIAFFVYLEELRTGKMGFEFHNARAGEVVMTKWLEPGTLCTLPLYPFTSIGVGALILNDGENEILLMKEKTGAYKGWKFPGGFANPGEDLFETARREVFEETGIYCTAVAVLSFRHMHRFKFPGCSDFYFVTLMHPDKGISTTPQPCPTETADCRWFKICELDRMNDNEFSPFSRHILGLHEEYAKNSVAGLKPKLIPSTSGIWKVYSVAISIPESV